MVDESRACAAFPSFGIQDTLRLQIFSYRTSSNESCIFRAHRCSYEKKRDVSLFIPNANEGDNLCFVPFFFSLSLRQSEDRGYWAKKCSRNIPFHLRIEFRYGCTYIHSSMCETSKTRFGQSVIMYLRLNMGYEKTGRFDCDSRIERTHFVETRPCLFGLSLLLERDRGWFYAIGPKRLCGVSAAVCSRSHGDLREVLLHYLAVFINEKLYVSQAKFT